MRAIITRHGRTVSRLLATAVALVAPGSLAASQQEAVTVLRGVDVVPLDSERVLEDHVVVVVDGRIRAVEPLEGFEVPDGARVIAGEGRTVVPGLVDMHVHLEYERPFQETFLDVYLAYGVTTVANLWGGPSSLSLRAALERKEVRGPRLVTTGPGINDSELDYEGGRELVRAQREAGFDFLKVYSDLSAEGFQGVAVQAGEMDMQMIGHVPAAVGLLGTLQSGQRMIAHAEELLYGHLKFRVTDVSGPADAGLDRERIPEIVQLLLDYETWLTPTFIAFEQIIAFASDYEAVLARPEAALVPPAIRLQTGWTERNRYRSRFSSTELQDRLRAALAYQVELVGAAHAAGVPILAGTDAMNPGVVPGASLHVELKRHVAAGFTNYEALRAATRRPAEFLGGSEKAGQVVPGAPADLVLLEANPLEDIDHTTRIAGVMVRGEWLDREELDGMLSRARERNAAQAKFLSLLDAREVSAAFELRGRVLESDPDAALFSEVSLSVAASGLRRGPGGAAEVFAVDQLMAETYPQSASAWDQLAETALLLEEKEIAREAFATVVELDPAGPLGQKAARKLEELAP